MRPLIALAALGLPACAGIADPEYRGDMLFSLEGRLVANPLSADAAEVEIDAVVAWDLGGVDWLGLEATPRASIGFGKYF